MNNNKTWLKWAMFVSFIVLVVGGLNYLFMGIFSFDMFGEIFGYDTAAGRVIFTIFGLAAVILAAIVVYKAFYAQTQSSTTASSTRASNRTSSTKSR